MSFQPPQKLLDAARNARKASGVSLEAASAQRIRDAKKQAEAGSEQHQENMRSLAKRIKEVRLKPLFGQSNTSKQRERTEEPGGTKPEPATSADSSLFIPEHVAPPLQKRKSSKTRAPDSRSEKKVKVGVEWTKHITEKGSSSIETVRQPQKTKPTTATNRPDLMETDDVPSNPTTASVPRDETQPYPILATLPHWYTSISTDSVPMKNLSKKRPPTLTALDALKALVRQCELAESKSLPNLPDLHDKLRDAVHKAEITLTVTAHILRKANMLSPQVGLPRIFQASSAAIFPPDLRADSYQLYQRWCKGDFTQDLLRGIITNKANNRSSDRISKAYREQFPTNAKRIGNNNLVLGQWWPTQLCAVRDGAHGSSQGGICGSRDDGAYSIVLSSGTGYQDVDHGDIIWYCGTRSAKADAVATHNTEHLCTSCENKTPVRVLRSAQLPRGNPYRPERGLRYDGLYSVTQYEVLDQENAVYRFRLERCEGQEPIRWQGKARRPTEYEIREYERLKEKGAW